MENNDQARWIDTVLHQLSRIDEEPVITALENCGRECLQSSGDLACIQELRDDAPDRDDVDALFRAYKERIYHDSPDLYREDGAIHLIYRRCGCGMVVEGRVTDPFLCHCTVGYTREIFETLFGRPVHVELQSSILRGDDACRLKITF